MMIGWWMGIPAHSFARLVRIGCSYYAMHVMWSLWVLDSVPPTWSNFAACLLDVPQNESRLLCGLHPHAAQPWLVRLSRICLRPLFDAAVSPPLLLVARMTCLRTLPRRLRWSPSWQGKYWSSCARIATPPFPRPLPAPVLPAPEMPVAAPLDLAVTGALSSLVDSNIYPGVRSAPRGPLASLASRPNPTGTSTLAPVMLRMLNAALTEGTRHAYKHAVTSFTAFSTTHFPASSVFPASIGALAAFVAHLFSQNYAPATLLTYMSALSYVHKLADMADPTQHFVIKKLLAGAQKLAAKPDTRLPITPTVLHKIVDATPFIVSSNYVCYMLQSMFLLSFHAFLRIGEITVHSRARHASVIQVSDVTISNSSLTLVMCHFKHNT